MFDLSTGKGQASTIDLADGHFLGAVGWVDGRAVVAVAKVDGKVGDPSQYKPARLHLMDILNAGEICAGPEADSNQAGRGSFSPDGSRFVFSSALTQCFINTPTGKIIRELPMASMYPFAIAWTHDSTQFALGRRSGVTPVGWVYDEVTHPTEPTPDWEVLLLNRDGNEVGRINVGVDSNYTDYYYLSQTPELRSVHFSPDARYLLLARLKDVRIFQMEGLTPSAKPVTTLKVPLRHIDSACFAGNDHVAVTTAEGVIVLFEWHSGKVVHKWQSTKLQQRLLLATADGKSLFTANGYEPYDSTHPESKTIRVWKWSGDGELNRASPAREKKLAAKKTLKVNARRKVKREK